MYLSCNFVHDFVMFYWSWSTYFCAFGVLISLHFYIFRDRYTVHPRLFADDGAFILASTLVARSTSGTNVLARIKAPSLVQEMDLDAHSAWLRVFGGYPFLLDAWNRHVLKKWNMKKLRVCFASDYSEISFKWVKFLLILFWIFAELYNCWSIVDCCRLAQCICPVILCMILWCFTDRDPRTSVLLVC